MARRRRRSARKSVSRACTKKVIRFKTKRGRVISFTGRHGLNCAPRFRKGVTPAALRPYAAAMKKCARKFKPGSKAIGKCVKTAV